MDCARIWTSFKSHCFTSGKVLQWHQVFCYVCPDVTERRISCLQTMVVLYLSLAFWEKKNNNLSCPEINPRYPTGSTAHSTWKAYKGNTLKMLQLVIAEILFTVLQPREFGLAWLGWASPFCAGPEPKREMGTRQPKSSLPMIPVRGQWGHWPQRGDGSTGLEGCVPFSSPITNLSHHCCHGAPLSACIALLEQCRQHSLHVEWSELRIFNFICGKCNCFLLC